MRLFRLTVFLATALAFGVVALGAYVRLSDAGLGCPDWPGCYGQLLGVPDSAHETHAAEAAFPDRPVEPHKAWKEMIHRYFAGGLGLLILAIAVMAWRQPAPLVSRVTPTALLGLIIFQALLGMWTVTLLLRPLVVSAHLLGGMATLALLVWLSMAALEAGSLGRRSTQYPVEAANAGRRRALRIHALGGLILVFAQIALGGWVSSNYAALACNDLPTCQGVWLPEMDFARAFHLHRELGQNADGSLLPFAALTAIHWTHRVGAVLVTLLVGGLGLRLLAQPLDKPLGLTLCALLLGQIGLGFANVLWSLPLPLAVAHNAAAAALLAILVVINHRLWSHAPLHANRSVMAPHHGMAAP